MAPNATLEQNTSRSTTQPEGLIFDIKRYAVHDGPGVRSVVFLKGCSLSCVWCHNPESISFQPELLSQPQRCIGCGACVMVCPNQVHEFSESSEHIVHRERCQLCGKCVQECYAEALVMCGRKYTVEQAMAILREDRGFYETSGGGVTLSGGEPFVQPEFSLALLRACRAEGIHTAVDTSGHIAWATLEAALPYTDIVLYDFKHMDGDEHRRLVGSRNELLLANLRRLSEMGVPIEIRIPVVPGVNDSPNMLADIGRFLGSLNNIVGVRLLPYHRLAGSKYASIGRPNTMPEVDSPSREQMEAAAANLQREGPLPIIISG
jgi:glycyl-radical enzyme activating protein